MSARPAYDYRNCQSLFGYAAGVHLRSGCVCQLCDADGGANRFDFWRQLTVEHLIGESQGGYLPSIKMAIAQRFPELPPAEAAAIAEQIDALNTVSACSFCNATTSRNRVAESMTDLIVGAPDVGSAVSAVRTACESILAAKRADVAWKLDAVRKAYDKIVPPSPGSVS